MWVSCSHGARRPQFWSDLTTPRIELFMKLRLLPLLGLCVFFSVRLPAEEAPPMRPPEQLDQLFGPIALYPDVLIALILPAATVPDDIAAAARYLDDNGDLAKADDESWDDSVKALVHYPDVVRWMAQNLAWTRQAGEAFLVQPVEVMNSIQRLRARARLAGTLVDTPEQRIVVDENGISILPARPEVIFVPSYDPEIVYLSRPRNYAEPFLTFGFGYDAGDWLGYDLDWRRHRIWTIDRHERERYWRSHQDWRRSAYPDRPDHADHADHQGHMDDNYHREPWAPTTNARPSPRFPGTQSGPEIAHPVPFPRDPSNHRPESKHHDPDFASEDSNHHRPPSDNRGVPTGHRPENPLPLPSAALPGNTAPSFLIVPVPAPGVQAQRPDAPPQYRRGGTNQDARGHEKQDGTPPTSQVRSAPSQPPPAVTPSRSQPPSVSPPPSRSAPSAPAARTEKSDRTDKNDRTAKE